MDPAASGNVVITYAAIDNAGKEDPTPGSVTLPFTGYSVSGNVYDDANGLTDSTVNGAGTNTGASLYAYLVTGTTISQVTTVAANGSYVFNSVSAASYTVRLSTTYVASGTAPAAALPSGWVNTGEFVGTGAGNDGTVDGSVAVTVSGAGVANVNFGIEQKPTANAVTAAAQLNPGSTTKVLVPALNGTDPEDATVTTFVIQTLPANGTLYYNGSAVTLGQVILNYNSSLLVVDPNDGNVTVSFTYAAQDAAGTLSTAATVTMPFTNLSIAGNVYDDANGLLGTPVNTVDGTGTNAGGTLFANLVNGSNQVVQSVLVGADGSYAFGQVAPNTGYSVMLSTNQGLVGGLAPLAVLPPGYVNTGENIGAGTGSDGTPDGILAVAVATSNVTNANFGIDRTPAANAVTAAAQPNPAGTTKVTVPTLSGSDPEDASVTTFVINLLPANGTLYYNGTAVILGQIIPNYSASLLTVDPNDGSITVSFTYLVTDAAGKSSASATVSMPFTAVGIAGNVYDDANGLTDSTVNGTGTNAGGLLYANLIDNTNKVAQAVAVAADGSYAFGTVVPNASYTVVLSTTQGTAGATAPAAALPAGYVNTGENIGAGAGSDGTPNGVLAVAVTTSSVSNANFGIDQLPNSGTATASSQVNPGGTTNVSVSANLFSGTDADGTVTSIRVTAFPSNATSVTINGTTYTSGSFPGAGVTVPANTSGQPTQAISVDPIDGAVSVVLSYAAIDNAAKEDPTPGSVTLPFATVSVSGTVFDDANGLTDSLINGTGTNAGGTLYANLVNGSGNVVAATAVASNGTYGFSGVNGGNFTVVLSTTQGTPGNAAPAASLPANWVNTGEGTSAAGDGTIDGVTAITVAAASVTGVNFGIDQLPNSGTATAASQVNPGGTTSVAVSASLFSATDADGTVASIRVTAFPSNATSITINGTTYTSGTFPGAGVTVPANTSGQPTQAVSVDPIDGAVSVVLSYAAIDNAGKEDPTPGSVTLPFTTVSVAGTVFDDANGLTDNLINGTGTNAGGTLYANLVNGSGNVVAATAVASNGTYNFSGVNGGSYTVVLSTTQGTPGNAAPAASLPTNWVNTGEGTNAAGDGTVNGVTPITVAASSVAGVNFGIDQLPNSGTATAASQSNPGGTASISVSASLFSATDADGTVASVRITAFPTNATSITINGTTYTSGTFPGAGVTVPANTSGQPTQAISVDPIDGAVSMAISYAAIDNAGKEDPSPGSVTLPFTIPLSGIVFDDADGSKIQNGTELGTNVGGLYVNLLDAAGANVVASVGVSAVDGAYSFAAVSPNTTYVLQLTTVQGTPGQPAPAITLPGGWVTTGENSNGTPDANPNSKLQVSVGTANATGQNFGIEQLPDTTNLTAAAQANPGGTTRVTVPTFAGTDPEDGALGSGKSFQITSLPASGTLYYNSTPVPLNQIITSYSPALLTVDANDGAVTVSFTYAAVDAAGKVDPTPATVTMPFTTLTITGTVWDDADGSANNTFSNIQNGSEPGTNGGGLYANLIGSDGKVIASVAVNSDGTYSFANLNGNQSNLTISLTTTAGTAGQAPPAAALQTNWVNTSPLTQTAFNLVTSNLTAKDFGIEQLPTAQGIAVAGQSNPTGTNSVTVPSANFVGTDPEGPVRTYVITAMPANATSITISGTLYTSIPGGGVSVTANSDGTLPTGAIAIDPVDGAVTVPILFKVIDAAGRSSNVATVNVPFGVQTLSGTVWDDADNSAAGTFSNIKTGSEGGTNAGGLYAILVASNGNEVANTAVLSDGSYTFGSVAPNQTAVTVRLATSAGTPGSPAPTAGLPTNWVNTSPLSQTAFDIATTSISGKDFGIEQLPDSGNKTAAAQANPGGTTQVQAPTLSGTDPEDGTLGAGMSLTITSLAANGTLYYNGTAVTLNQVITAYNPSWLTVDPNDGAVTVTFAYAVHDAAGKVDPTPATVTMPFTNIGLTGTVFDDANGSQVQNGLEAGTNAGGGLYVNLVNLATTVLATATVNSSGIYSFSNVPPNTTYELQLTTNAGTVGQPEPATALPANWVTTGENASGTPDGSPDGILQVVVGTSDLTSRNFGIEQLPDTLDRRPPAQANPGGTVKVTVPTLAGTDPEDGTLGSGSSFKIISLPTTGTLYYDGVAVTLNQVISSYDPSKLTVDPNDGAVTVSFAYAAVDAAGRVDPSPAAVIMPFTNNALTGTVFDDANGSQMQDGGESGTNAAGTYVNLLDATGTTVLATATVNPNGTYSFANVPPNTTYELQLSINQGTVGQAAPATALPAGWVTTGENSNGTPDGAPNSLLAVVMGTSGVSGQNFGIEQLPTANPVTAASQLNPGGSARVVVPTLSGSDPEDASVTTFVINTLPANGTLYYNGTPVTLGQIIPNYSASLLTVDPIDGSITVSFTYSVTDAAGKFSAPAAVTMPFTAVGIAGNVYDDANGLTDNTVNGSGSNAGGTLYANLVDGSDKVVQAVAVAGGGSYSFGTVAPNTSYTIVLSTTQGTAGATAPAAALPAGYANTGEHIGTGTGSDGTPDGILAVAVTTSSVSNANFGFDQLPDSGTATASGQVNPGGTTSVAVSASLFSATDADGTVTSIRITSFPSNATSVTINGTTYTSGSFPGAGVTVPTNGSGQPTQAISVDPIDGAVSVVISYAAIDNAGKEDPSPGSVTLPFTTVSVAGTVFDDANGLTDSLINGTGTNVGNTLYANLVNGSGTVVAATAVASNGIYGFSGVNGGNYTVVLSTTQGTPGNAAPAPSLPASWWVNTGEGTNPAGDGTVDGVTAITVAAANVSGVNFGIEQLPNSGTATASGQVNPGGTTGVPVNASLFSATDADGTVTSIRITAFSTNATSITINGTTYTAGSFPGAGVTVPTNGSGQPTQAISVDPSDGAVSVAISYAAIDNAGKEDPSPGSVTLVFTTVSVAGTVFDDANGLTDNLINGTGTNVGNTLYANLVNGSGTVVAATAVASNGIYGFSGVNGGNYTVVLSTTQGTPGNAAPVASLPANWVNTGEHLGAGSGSDGTPNGNLAVVVSTSSISNANFGIDQLPDTSDLTAAAQPNPGGTTKVMVPTLAGSDPEDGVLGSGNSFEITSLPNSGTLYYDGSPATLNQILSAYDPTKLTVDPYDGAVTVSFTYAAVDAAGKADPTAATVTMPFTAVGIAGHVFDDANGLTDNTVNGTGTNAGGTLYANLINGSNKVVQAVAVAVDGSYVFGTVTSNTSYTVVLSTTQGTAGNTAPAPSLPANWVNTGENIGTGTGSDGAPDGSLAVMVTTSSVTNANFGIEQPPTANPVTAASQLNPAGTAQVTVPTLSGSDPEDAAVTTFVISTLPANATLFYNGTPVTLGQVIPSYSPSLLTLDPNDGSISVGFTYSVTDAAGQSSAPATVSMPFVAIGIAGNVYDDANGLTDNTVNGTGTNAGGTLYANLVDGTNQVVQAVAVAADGSYAFGTVAPNTSYTLVLSTTQGTPGNTAPAAALPAGYANTGENIGAGAGSDGSPDGRLAVAVTTSSITNANFGIHPAAISGYVLAGTTPIAGVLLTLLDRYGNPVDGDPNTPGVQRVTAVTDSNGFYIFSGIAPGIYQVAQTQPSGYSSFGDRDGGNLNIIGDVTPVVVLAGQTNANNTFLETSDCPSNWAEWISQRPGQGAGDNPDGDAYDNLAEFAFAMPSDSGAGNAWRIEPSALNPDILEGVFVRPIGAPLNVTYSLQYAASAGNPTVWQTLVITPDMVTVVANDACTETVTIPNLESLTGLTGGSGVVRIQAALDTAPPSGTDHTSYTEVEGWTETALGLCCRTYNNPYLRETVFTGTVSGVSGQNLSFATSAGSVDLASLLVAGVPYYLEVTSGSNEGQRLDVASASGITLTVANDSNVYGGSAPFNTLSGAPPAGLVGAQVVLRQHWTLNEVFPPAGFGASGSQATSDEVQVFVGGAWKIYWLYNGDAPTRWVDAADAGMADQGATVIPPGQGMFFNNRTVAGSILAYGELRANAFVRPLAAGYNLVGGGYPLDQSASGAGGRAMSLTAGFFGSRDFQTADSFFTWNADATVGASGYTSYYLLNGAPVSPALIRWVKVGDSSASSRGSELLLRGNGAVFTRSASALPGYGCPLPWAP